MAADGVQVLELEMQLKVAADNFYDVFKKKEDISTDKTEVVAVHHRDSQSNSSTQSWSFIVEGKVEHIKEKIELDEQNKTVSFIAVEGDVMKQYKSYKITLHVVPTGEGCIAKWTWEYEKLHDDVPPPTKYASSVADFSRDLETILSQ
ncbi:PREDICTED: major latex protein 146 [Tarenaya hassleriana]|uniref:major latex protein 146 n=1 Tax=Tarenaya hassleriana TaxID=28532 RepID=UPI00053CA12E|nr:PREDICTED: major latex protein 146 [Tarenaya hassleriana]